jgi:hypothetical protein
MIVPQARERMYLYAGAYLRLAPCGHWARWRCCGVQVTVTFE